MMLVVLVVRELKFDFPNLSLSYHVPVQCKYCFCGNTFDGNGTGKTQSLRLRHRHRLTGTTTARPWTHSGRQSNICGLLVQQQPPQRGQTRRKSGDHGRSPGFSFPASPRKSTPASRGNQYGFNKPGYAWNTGTFSGPNRE